ncbi:uncharacterized protein [Rutidosis leptorrhynchoides]|uniref:uncharacterized protein n=1 Tax=Rutidosis leptorrhynchoides TaxID=125765 RepID=UPI003A9A11E4
MGIGFYPILNPAFVPDDVLLPRNSDLSLSLLGKVFNPNKVVFHAMRANVKFPWNLLGEFFVREVGFNLYSFLFKCLEDRRKVSKDGPWWFEKHLMVLQDVDPFLRPEDMTFYSQVFWVQLHQMSFLVLNSMAGRVLGKRIGEVLNVDDRLRRFI